jgi:hypothetical protein
LNIHELVRDIRQVREHGVDMDESDIPALYEAVERRWPGGAKSGNPLRSLLLESAEKLDPRDAEGIRLALGLTTIGRSSADRRTDFATHYKRTSDGVRKPRTRRPSIEVEAFTNLAAALLELPGLADRPEMTEGREGRTRSGAGSASISATNGAADPEQLMRAFGSEAERQGNFAAASSWGVALVAVLRQRADANPGDYETETELAIEYMSTGIKLFMAGDATQSQDQLIRAERIHLAMAEMQPDVALHRACVAACRLMLGFIALAMHDVSSAEGYISNGVATMLQLRDDGQSDADDTLMLANGLALHAALFHQADRTEAALGAITTAVELSEELGETRSSSTEEDLDLTRHVLANALVVRGGIEVSADQYAEAKLTLTRAIHLFDASSRTASPGGFARLLLAAAPMNIANAHQILGIAYACTDQLVEAELALRRAVDILSELGDTAAHPNRLPDFLLVQVPNLHAVSLTLLGLVYVDIDASRKAEETLEAAAELLQTFTHDGGMLSMLADVLTTLSELYQSSGRDAEAEHARDRGRAIRGGQQGDDPGGSTQAASL